MPKFTFYEVGGAVRDKVLGIPDAQNKSDVDYSVVADRNDYDIDQLFEDLQAELKAQDFVIFKAGVEKNYQTIKARVPQGHPLRHRCEVADFVLARAEGGYVDGRRPTWVRPGSLEDDLLRRDFTVNALAIDPEGNLIDLVGGLDDIESRTLRFVGNPTERIEEDAVRILRALRFKVKLGFTLDPETRAAIWSPLATQQLQRAKIEKIREELCKMFHHDTLASLELVQSLPKETQRVIFREGLWLNPTTRVKP